MYHKFQRLLNILPGKKIVKTHNYSPIGLQKLYKLLPFISVPATGAGF